MHNRPFHQGVGGWRKIVAAVVLAALLLVGIGAVVAGPARADDVDSLEQRAQQIAQTLMDLELQVANLSEQFNQAQVRLELVRNDQRSTQHKLAKARDDEAQRRRDLTRYALASYVGAGSDQVVPLALDGRQWDLARRDGYVSSAIGRRQQVVDNLLAAQKVSADLLDDLNTSKTEAESLTAELAAAQSKASRLMAEQRKLQESVQGKLADAVEKQQAELAAKAQAEAQARQEAAFGTNPTAVTQPQTTGTVTVPNMGPTSAPTQTPATTTATSVPRGSNTTSPANPAATVPPTAPPTTRPPVTVPPVVTPPPPASGKGQIAMNAAMRQIGVRYSWGGGNAQGPSYGFGEGAGVKGFDCSGLTLYAWAQAGVYLYHSAQMQYDMARKVPMQQLAVGDLVFYGSSSRTISHVGLYIGNGQVVHAPNSRSTVQVGSVYLWNGYYAWVGAGRPG